jgi:four helix bundle protein
MTKEEMKTRTKRFALAVIRFVQSLPKDRVADVLGTQLLRAATSVGSNYRAACRAKSTADFIHKLKIVEEESDESQFWMEILVESGLIALEKLDALIREADEILAIIVATLKSVRGKR